MISVSGGLTAGAVLLTAFSTTLAQNAPRAPARPPAAQNAQASPQPAAPAAPAPVPADPQMTTAAYGDWVLRCQRNGEAAQAPRICEVAQTIQSQGQGALAQIAFGRVEPKEPLRLTVVVPHNVSFPGGVKMAIDDKDGQAGELGWRRCLPVGCVADAEVKEDLLRRWRTQTGGGRMMFKDASGRDVALPWSFRGLSQALDALAKS